MTVDPFIDDPMPWVIRMRLTRTDGLDGVSRGVIDMDGEPVARVEFVSKSAAEAYEAFLARLCRVTP